MREHCNVDGWVSITCAPNRKRMHFWATEATASNNRTKRFLPR